MDAMIATSIMEARLSEAEGGRRFFSGNILCNPLESPDSVEKNTVNIVSRTRPDARRPGPASRLAAI
jgi:hypothetical protein